MVETNAMSLAICTGQEFDIVPLFGLQLRQFMTVDLDPSDHLGIREMGDSVDCEALQGQNLAQ